MNILFVDSSNNKLKFGFNIKKIKGRKIYSLKISNNINKLVLRLIKLYFKIALKKQVTYIVTSKYFKYDLDKIDENYINVTEQNNLLLNDIKYINEYIEKEKLDKRDIKMLLIFDEFTDIIKEKLNYYIENFKLTEEKELLSYYNENNNIPKEFENNLNNKTGSVIEILDKFKEEDYNILLVFSNKYKVSQSKRSFCLDYNNSELDVKSNTYLIYQNNKNIYLKLFKDLNLDIQRFNKTKLGKLYIHTSGIMLDK